MADSERARGSISFARMLTNSERDISMKSSHVQPAVTTSASRITA